MRCNDLHRAALMACLLLADCTDTRDLAPPSASEPWRTTTITEPQPSPGTAAVTARSFGLPRDLTVRPHEALTGLDPAHIYTLAELIDIAQRRNKETQVAWEQARQAAINVGISRAAFLPEVTVSALGGYQRIASPFPSNLAPRGYISAQAQELLPELAIRYLLLDFGGGREATEQVARQLSFAANVGFNGAHQKLIYTVARNYFVLDGANGQLRAAQRSLTDARTLQEQAEARLGRGIGTTVDVQLARRATAQATYDVAQATATQHEATYSLLQALELPPTTALKVQDSSARPLPRGVARTVDEMMNAALSQRADLMAQLAKLRAAEANIERTRADFYPKLSLQANVQANLGRISVDNGPYQSVSQPQTGVFLRFDWPLYQGGLRRNRERIAESQRTEADDMLEQSSTAAMREVAVAYDQLQTGLSQYDAAVALQAAAQASSDSAREAFARGLGGLSDALNAETALASSAAVVSKAHAQSLINAAGLAFAAGELTSGLSPAIAAADQ